MSGSRAERLRMYHGWLKKKTWNHAKERRKAWKSNGFRYIQVVVVAGRLKREKKKSKNFCMYFCFFRVLSWLLALEQRHPVLKDFGVFGSRLSEVFSDEHFGFGRREGKKMCRRRGRKKEIIEDKNNYNSKIFDFTNKQNCFGWTSFIPKGQKKLSWTKKRKIEKRKRKGTLFSFNQELCVTAWLFFFCFLFHKKANRKNQQKSKRKSQKK